MEYRIAYVDAFTATPFHGNPCAVVPQAEGLTEQQMQLIARESNQPETSFVLGSTKADFRVCYFTPRHRIPFAGHPTIATGFLLAEDGRIQAGKPAVVDFEFDIGVLPVQVYFHDSGAPSKVVMCQGEPVFGKEYGGDEICPCFNLEQAELLQQLPAQVISTGVPFLIVPVRDLEVLKNVEMDRPRLRELLHRAGAAAAFLFCLQGFDEGSDTHARLLDPDGTMEDPFTGSASGCMGAYIIARGLKPGPVLNIEQGHLMGRPGEGELEIGRENDIITGIRLGGTAVKTLEGKINISAEEL
ncbi:MAG: PhzF family phenazine biosynthesis protein [Spirochaetaceae bacterium]|nr:MAG: PhzF family phenazine biosynthesis protein [Spirochaetaceae bacterium]